MTACFTGHRPNKLKGYSPNDNKELLWNINTTIKECINIGYNTFISGMALGVDIWSAQIVLKLKESYDIQLVCAVPCKNQSSYWSSGDKQIYQDILNKADEVIYISEEYTSRCMKDRNKYMVDNSDLVIAVWDGLKGSGTSQCVHYAKFNEKEVINLWNLK